MLTSASAGVAKVVGGGGSIWGMGRILFTHSYQDIIFPENLLASWQGFVKGKRNRKDVQKFERNLMDNIFTLHRELHTQTYRHGPYYHFKISDPKPRDIHKATVKDRLVHHALYRQLYPFFDRTFIADSYSCRKGRGVHKALNAFRDYGYKVSANHTETAWVLKCDIRKFFASIDHDVLLDIVGGYITDKNIRWLIGEVVGSFRSEKKNVGLPLGNLTSQLLVNIYMNRFDQFAKHSLKAHYYVRYADDFAVLSQNRTWLEGMIPIMADFLYNELRLELHPNKVTIRSLSSGVEFLGWVHFPDHRVLRTATKRRMLKKVNQHNFSSYVGLLKHGNAQKLKNRISNTVRF